MFLSTFTVRYALSRHHKIKSSSAAKQTSSEKELKEQAACLHLQRGSQSLYEKSGIKP